MTVRESVKYLVSTSVAGYEQFWLSKKIPMSLYIEEMEAASETDNTSGVRVSCKIAESNPVVIFEETDETIDACYAKIALTIMAQGVSSLYCAVIKMAKQLPPEKQIPGVDISKFPPFDKKLIIT